MEGTFTQERHAHEHTHNARDRQRHLNGFLGTHGHEHPANYGNGHHDEAHVMNVTIHGTVTGRLNIPGPELQDISYPVANITEAMTIFCTACALCGPPLVDGYPQCLRDDDPTPGGNGPFCERCRDEFFRLYDGGEPAQEHKHAVFLCCLETLVAEVMEYATDLVMVEREQAEALFELLSLHVEEAWEAHEEDIIAPEDPYAEQRADFEDDVMSDLLADQCRRDVAN